MPEPEKPTVILTHPMLERMGATLEAAGYHAARLWVLGEDERQAARALVHAGEVQLSPDLLMSLPKLGLIANVSVGYDGVDVAWCRAHGIEVTHARGLNAEDVADHAIGLLVASWRSIVVGDAMVRDGRWAASERLGVRPSLGGRKVGIVGLGAIGVAVARRAEALRMVPAWWGPTPKPDAPWPRAESLLALAADSDVLVVACRAEAANRGLISQAVIEAVGPKGLIVNVARGSLIDERALIAALKDGRLGRAALDVFDVEPTPPARWADVPNTLLTPHVAGSTTDVIPLMVGQALDNLRLFLAGEPVASPVAGA